MIQSLLHSDSTVSVLFVDDESELLHGLSRALGNLTNWKLYFAGSGKEGIELLDNHRVDVVVSDIRMPIMNGVEFLDVVRAAYPQIMRIVLSGQADAITALRSATVAHQFLAKPCEIETLISTVNRHLFLKESLSGNSVGKFAHAITKLPSVPGMYTEITNELNKVEPSTAKVCEIVAKDTAMTAKLLQLVNSAFFGLPRVIQKPSEAVLVLGWDILRALVLSVKAFEQFDVHRSVRFDIEQFNQKSLKVASAARALAISENLPPSSIDAAYASGLLHDIGALVVVSIRPELWEKQNHLQLKRHLSAKEAQLEALNTTHAVLGAHLLAVWGLPLEVVQAIANLGLTPEPESMSPVDLVLAKSIAMVESELSGETQLEAA